MRALVTLVGLSWLLSASTPPPALSAADRDKAVKYLETTRQNLLVATKGLSDAQWNFKPAPDRWSVAEVLEHIVATEDLLYGKLTEKIMKAPPRAEVEDVAAIDSMVLERIPDRSKKAKAPDEVQPTNRYQTPEGTLKHFADTRDRTIAFLKKTDDLRAHASDSPLGKKLDAYEFILFIGAHSERHTKQINEVKADPNFPKATKT